MGDITSQFVNKKTLQEPNVVTKAYKLKKVNKYYKIKIYESLVIVIHIKSNIKRPNSSNTIHVWGYSCSTNAFLCKLYHAGVNWGAKRKRHSMRQPLSDRGLGEQILFMIGVSYPLSYLTACDCFIKMLLNVTMD